MRCKTNIKFSKQLKNGRLWKRMSVANQCSSSARILIATWTICSYKKMANISVGR